MTSGAEVRGVLHMSVQALTSLSKVVDMRDCGRVCCERDSVQFDS